MTLFYNPAMPPPMGGIYNSSCPLWCPGHPCPTECAEFNFGTAGDDIINTGLPVPFGPCFEITTAINGAFPIGVGDFIGLWDDDPDFACNTPFVSWDGNIIGLTATKPMINMEKPWTAQICGFVYAINQFIGVNLSPGPSGCGGSFDMSISGSGSGSTGGWGFSLGAGICGGGFTLPTINANIPVTASPCICVTASVDPCTGEACIRVQVMNYDPMFGFNFAALGHTPPGGGSLTYPEWIQYEYTGYGNSTMLITDSLGANYTVPFGPFAFPDFLHSYDAGQSLGMSLLWNPALDSFKTAGTYTCGSTL